MAPMQRFRAALAAANEPKSLPSVGGAPGSPAPAAPSAPAPAAPAPATPVGEAGAPTEAPAQEVPSAKANGQASVPKGILKASHKVHELVNAEEAGCPGSAGDSRPSSRRLRTKTTEAEAAFGSLPQTPIPGAPSTPPSTAPSTLQSPSSFQTPPPQSSQSTSSATPSPVAKGPKVGDLAWRDLTYLEQYYTQDSWTSSSS